MPATYKTDQSADTTVTLQVETVVATLTGITTQRPGQQVALEGYINFLVGTATTALQLRIREDSLTGAVVSEPQTRTIDTAAGSTEDHTIMGAHTPAGEVSGKTYVLTVQQTAATGDGTCTHSSLRADLNP